MWNIKLLLNFVSLCTIEFQISYIKENGCSIKENERMVRFSFLNIYKPILAIISWSVANSLANLVGANYLRMWIAWDMVASNENRGKGKTNKKEQEFDS